MGEFHLLSNLQTYVDLRLINAGEQALSLLAMFRNDGLSITLGKLPDQHIGNLLGVDGQASKVIP
ncbi:hypothetical protein IBA8401_28070 [Pseudomonas syringae]